MGDRLGHAPGLRCASSLRGCGLGGHVFPSSLVEQCQRKLIRSSLVVCAPRYGASEAISLWPLWLEARTPAPPKRPVRAPKLRTAQGRLRPDDPARGRRFGRPRDRRRPGLSRARRGDDEGSAATGVASGSRAALGGSFRDAAGDAEPPVQGLATAATPLPPGSSTARITVERDPHRPDRHLEHLRPAGAGDLVQSLASSTRASSSATGLTSRRARSRRPVSSTSTIPTGFWSRRCPAWATRSAFTAWTASQGARNDRTYEGEGRLAKVKRFDDDAFNAFVDNPRPRARAFPVSDLQPGSP